MKENMKDSHKKIFKIVYYILILVSIIVVFIAMKKNNPFVILVVLVCFLQATRVNKNLNE